MEMCSLTISENCRDAIFGARKVEMCSLTSSEIYRDALLGARKETISILTIHEVDRDVSFRDMRREKFACTIFKHVRGCIV